MADRLQDLDNMLTITAEVLVQKYTAQLGDIFAGNAGSSIYEFTNAPGDKVCELCRALNGQRIKVDSPNDRFRPPVHINCRCIPVWIKDDEIDPETGEPVQPSDFHIPEDLVEQHGQFVARPHQYASLRVPARPEGRDFIFIPGKRGERGRLVWRPGLPDYAVQDALIIAGNNLLAVWEEQSLSPEHFAQAASDLAYHAASRPIHTHWRHDFETHRDNWASHAAVLSEAEYQQLASETVAAPDSAAVLTSYRGERVVAFFAHRLQIGEYEYRDVWVDYHLQRGALGHIMRVKKPVKYLRGRRPYTILRGGLE
ncbi:MAG: hypothetical protein H5T86_15240 [Armatimonadetes bacterium]|nr:hypothetical protein [Armatimonadota bacterium]